MRPRGSSYVLGAGVLAARREYTLVESEPVRDEETVVGDQIAAEVEAADDRERPTPAALVDRALPSPIASVGNEAWTEFAIAMKTQDPTAVSASNEYGMFAIKPLRLVDLGLMSDAEHSRAPVGRMAWVGRWVAPLTEEDFLSNPRLQYKAFCASMKRYANGIVSGSVPYPDGGLDGVTLSGALAILHRCGPNGLVRWATDAGNRFPTTLALFTRANGIF